MIKHSPPGLLLYLVYIPIGHCLYYNTFITVGCCTYHNVLHDSMCETYVKYSTACTRSPIMHYIPLVMYYTQVHVNIPFHDYVEQNAGTLHICILTEDIVGCVCPSVLQTVWGLLVNCWASYGMSNANPPSVWMWPTLLHCTYRNVIHDYKYARKSELLTSLSTSIFEMAKYSRLY